MTVRQTKTVLHGGSQSQRRQVTVQCDDQKTQGLGGPGCEIIENKDLKPLGTRPSTEVGARGTSRAGTRGHIVQTPGKKKPYKAVLEHERGDDTEHFVSTIREGEAFIRKETPAPEKRDTSRDRKARKR